MVPRTSCHAWITRHPHAVCLEILACLEAHATTSTLEYCTDLEDVQDTWFCQGPESCGCNWTLTTELRVVPPRDCKAMGSEAIVALRAPSQLAPHISLPNSAGGSTGYYSPTIRDGTTSWAGTAMSGCEQNSPPPQRIGRLARCQYVSTQELQSGAVVDPFQFELLCSGCRAALQDSRSITGDKENGRPTTNPV